MSDKAQHAPKPPTWLERAIVIIDRGRHRSVNRYEVIWRSVSMERSKTLHWDNSRVGAELAAEIYRSLLHGWYVEACAEHASTWRQP